MIVSNITRGTIVAAEAAEAHSFTAKLFGLMGKAGMASGAALLQPVNIRQMAVMRVCSGGWGEVVAVTRAAWNTRRR